MSINDSITRDIVKMFPETRRYLRGRARWIAYAIQPAVKTYEHYLRQVEGLVNALWDGSISESEFVDSMAEYIPAQLTKAWREGMRENGLDPDTEMEQEWQDQLDAMILSEYDFVDRFAADIVRTSKTEGASIDGMLSRAQLWANRYNDVFNEAILRTSDGKFKLKWTLGATEEHCTQCAALNGIVAFSREWEQSGFRPQQPQNDMLECGGWRCDCTLTETQERRSQDALGQLMNIAQGVGL